MDELNDLELPQNIDASAELELFNNVVAVLGGEMAIGLDGPALPTPAWKAVVEAFDANVLQDGVEQSIALFNEHSAANGVGASIDISSANINAYSGYEINLSVDESIAIGDLSSASFNYAYVDGYLIAAPNAVLIERAIDFYESGSNLQTDSEFRELLARDGYLDFSAVYFSRLGQLIGNLTQNLPSTLTEEQQAAVSALDVEAGATMGSVLALPDKIHFSHSGSSQMPIQIMSQLLALQPLIESMAGQVDVQ